MSVRQLFTACHVLKACDVSSWRTISINRLCYSIVRGDELKVQSYGCGSTSWATLELGCTVLVETTDYGFFRVL